MTPRKEQRDRCWGDLELKTNADGLRYVKFSAPSAKQKRELVKTQELSEKASQKQASKASQRRSKTLTIMIAVLSQPIWPISNIDHKK